MTEATGHGGSTGRERAIIRAFVELSHELVDDYDVVEMLTNLTASCVELIGVDSAGLLLADGHGTLHLAASSSEELRHLEVFQLQREEGPCLEAFDSGHQVVAADLTAIEERWPRFAQAATRAGVVSVHALPMRLRGQRLGTLGLFGATPGLLHEHDLELAQAFVHVASVAIANEQHVDDRKTLNAHLQRALLSRVALEQAKGILAFSGDLDMADAFTVLRRYARDHQVRLGELAAQVVTRVVLHTEVLEHARSVGVLPPRGS